MTDERHGGTEEGSVIHSGCSTELAACEAKWKRALADLANREKEFTRERSDLAQFAAADVLRDLLPLVDALDAAQSGGHDAGSGIPALATMLRDLLQRHGVMRIPTDGPLDYLAHDVVASEPKANVAPGTIVAVRLPGYLLHGRCLRPAKVVVATVPAENNGSSP